MVVTGHHSQWQGMIWVSVIKAGARGMCQKVCSTWVYCTLAVVAYWPWRLGCSSSKLAGGCLFARDLLSTLFEVLVLHETKITIINDWRLMLGTWLPETNSKMPLEGLPIQHFFSFKLDGTSPLVYQPLLSHLLGGFPFYLHSAIVLFGMAFI